MNVLPERAVARADRPASRVVHDESSMRVVSFYLRPGQRIPGHRTDSTVIVHVVEGAGTFRGGNGEVLLGPGESAVFAPNEKHAIEANSVPLEFLAFISPRPGG